ncbi:glycosyltransferase family 2 protein [Aeromicrobium sp.]|nr:glycosyltransferase family 2 protein [Candidatus Saccharibacteria bacterium]
MKQSAISVIIPTLNEADNIPLLFERLHTTLQKASIPFEILVVDDHSTDATVALTRAADPKFNARAILKQGKPGKAFSLLEGFAAAQHDVICMIDADLQYPPEAIAQMYHKMQFCDADVVITNRIDNKTGLLRKLSTGAFHLVFTKMLFGIDYDTQSGLKLFKKRVLDTMTIAPSAWTFDLEFIIRALENDNIILSEDIAFAERNAGVAKLNLFTAAFEGAWQSLKLYRTTSVKRVKSRYEYLKPLQQSFNWMLAITIGALVAFGGMTQTADAASLQPIKSATDAIPQLLDPITLPAPTPSEPATNSSPTPAPESTSSTGSTTPPSSATPSSTTTKSAGTTTPKSSATPNLSVSTTPTRSSITQPGSLTTQDGKQAPYYPQSKLSSSKTANLHNLALLTLKIGGASFVFGLVLLSVRNLARRMQQRQQSSVNA